MSYLTDCCLRYLGLIVEVHPQWHLKGPPPAPVPDCGTWAIIDGRESGPGERPCGTCKYGVERTHVVTHDDLNNVKNKRCTFTRKSPNRP